jgi:XTP/dITP diphosphohydrolase
VTDSAAVGEALRHAASTVDRLRSPGGCPWDAEQTHASLAPYLIEEAYETLEAIETGDRTLLREELGDLLFQVLFHARVAEEAPAGDRFELSDVADDLVAKLVRRHPHVFADVTVSSAAEVNANWDAIKQAEKRRDSVTDGIPLVQPALALAAKLASRRRKAGLEVDPPAGSGIGPRLLALVDAAVQAGIDPEQALRATTREYAAAIRAAERDGATRTAERGGKAGAAEGSGRPNPAPIPVARTEPPASGSEKELLVAFLDYHRQTLRMKCADLTPGQLLELADPPSTLRLLGLVRHLTEVEARWLSHRCQGEEMRWVYGSDADPDGDLNVEEASHESVAATWARYDDQVARSRRVVATTDLDRSAVHPTPSGQRPTLRWILLHLIEEYARHNGHADLLREHLDGVTGE